MKRYVYSKGESSITVETDAFGSIDNFVVTGIFTVKADEMIYDGFDIKTGDTVSKAKMANLAKVCKCKLDVYGSNETLIEEESIDMTEEEDEEGDE